MACELSLNTTFNKNTQEYQTLQDMSGVSGIVLDCYIEYSLNNLGRFPKLDEIAGANSKNYLFKSINIQSNGDLNYTTLDNILKYTHTDNITDAQIKLNKVHSDLTINLIQVQNSVLVYTLERPSINKKVENNNGIPTKKLTRDQHKLIIGNAILKLGLISGIKINTITSEELESEQWKEIVPEASCVNAFIYNGEIYINIDNASADSKMHELTHMIFGSIRYTNTFLYQLLIQTIGKIPSIKNLSRIYRNRTESDVLEEAFVLEFSKFLTGQKSLFDEIDDISLNNIFYEMLRVLDTILDGNYSIKSIPISEVSNSSLSELAEKVESSITQISHHNALSDSEIHRIMNNKKSELMQSGKLTEICY